MGMFSSLFGSAGSDKADQLRQKAYDAFNAVKTPELSQLQVQLQKYVDAGQLTPEQAEVQLIKSNAFNDIATDPSLKGAQKQALVQLQDIGKQGGLTAIDKSQLQDISDQQNQEARGRNEAILANTKERGVGGSGIETVNRLMNEQAAADRASRQGTDVAAQAQQRALASLQAAGQLGGQMDAAQFGQGAQKATAQNAIDAFNAQTSNANNLYNTQTANQAQAANLANKQGIDNANTGVANTQATQNANAVQQQYNDALQKAQGEAGVFTNWAGAADADNRAENAADLALTAGAVKAGASALGTAMGGPAGGAAASAASPDVSAPAGYSPNMAANQTSRLGYAEGGVVEDSSESDPSLEDAYKAFTQKYCYGGSVKMADGGSVTVKAAKKAGALPIDSTPNSQGFTLKDPKGQPIGDFDSYMAAADFEKKVKEKQPNTEDFRDGGKVPGVAPVAGDSEQNDIVPAKLSPGEVVVPRSVVAQPEQVPQFVEKAAKEDPMITALRRLRNPTVGSARG